MNKSDYSRFVKASVIVVLVVAPLALAGFGLFKLTEPIRTSAHCDENGVLLKLESQLDSADRPTSLTRTLTYGSCDWISQPALKQALGALQGNPFVAAPATLKLTQCPAAQGSTTSTTAEMKDPQQICVVVSKVP
jgi:hypothetical protein